MTTDYHWGRILPISFLTLKWPEMYLDTCAVQKRPDRWITSEKKTTVQRTKEGYTCLRFSMLCLFVCLFGFLPSSSTTRLYRGRAPRQSVWQFYVLPHMRQSWETMTSVSAGHIILTPTQPVGSGRSQRESNPGPPHQEPHTLPTELPRPLYAETTGDKYAQNRNTRWKGPYTYTNSVLNDFLSYFAQRDCESVRKNMFSSTSRRPSPVWKTFDGRSGHLWD